jgi:hypothetical protein
MVDLNRDYARALKTDNSRSAPRSQSSPAVAGCTRERTCPGNSVAVALIPIANAGVRARNVETGVSGSGAEGYNHRLTPFWLAIFPAPDNEMYGRETVRSVPDCGIVTKKLLFFFAAFDNGLF